MYWTTHIEGGPERVNHAAVAVDDKIYTFGGYCTGENFFTPNEIDIYIFHTENLKWRPLQYIIYDDKSVPHRVYGHSVVAYGHKIYLWGGRNDVTAYNTLYCFDIDSLKWSLPPTIGQPPPPLDGHTACVVGSFMYIYGGYEDISDMFLQNTYRINLEDFKWEKVNASGTPPFARDYHTASVIGDRMYIFGGRSNLDPRDEETDFYDNQITYLDTSTMTWISPKTTGVIPQGRRSHACVVYMNEIYIVGGYCSSNKLHFNDIFKFNPFTNAWLAVKAKGKYPDPSRRQAACVVGDTMYLFGGCKPNPNSLDAVEVSDLFVLDFFPTLKKYSQLSVIKNNLNYEELPKVLRKEIKTMTCK